MSMTFKKGIVWSLSIVAIGCVSVEIVARFALGLGDPPISIADAEIDYLFKPNQDCHRFGNHIAYNRFSMRSTRNPEGMPKEGERRVLIIGDSVVNGGVLTDQAAMANELLDAYLRETKQGDAYNISAGSWGPMNYAAYLRKYGTFGATDVVVEVNCHDLWEDDPKASGGRYVGHDVSLPDHKPILAAYEGFTRYFLPRIRRWLGTAVVNDKVDVARWGSSLQDPLVAENLKALDYIYSLPVQNKYLVIHRSQKEWRAGGVPLGEETFRAHAERLGVKVLVLELEVPTDFRDNIHPNANGQRKLYELLRKALFEPHTTDE